MFNPHYSAEWRVPTSPPSFLLMYPLHTPSMVPTHVPSPLPTHHLHVYTYPIRTPRPSLLSQPSMGSMILTTSNSNAFFPSNHRILNLKSVKYEGGWLLTSSSEELQKSMHCDQTESTSVLPNESEGEGVGPVYYGAAPNDSHQVLMRRVKERDENGDAAA